MAEDANNPFEEGESGGSPQSGGGLKLAIRLALMVAVLGIGSAAGYTLGGIFHGSPAPDPNQPPVQVEAFEESFAQSDIAGEDFEYVDFEPITVNLNEPGLARYIRATIILAVRKRDFEAARDRIEKKKKELRNSLTVYLSGRTLEDVRGPENLNRIRRETQEACNKQLWPRGRPLIDHVLFKEFAVQ